MRKRRELGSTVPYIEVDGYATWAGDAIPADKLANASDSYGFGDEEAFYLFDGTFWGSAKNGVLIACEGLGFRFDDGPPVRMRWQDIEGVYSRNGHLAVIGDGFLWDLVAARAPKSEPFFEAVQALAAFERSPFMGLVDEFNSAIPDSAEEATPEQLAQARQRYSKLEEFRRTHLQANAVDSLDAALDTRLIFGDGKVTARPCLVTTAHVMETLLQRLFDPEGARQRSRLLAEALRARLEQGDEDELWLQVAITTPLLLLISNYPDSDGLPPDAREALRQFVKVHGDQEEREKADAKFGLAQLQRQKQFEELPSARRRVLVCTDAVPAWFTEELRAISYKDIEALKWRFPLGHPESESLYVIHPLRSDLYVPIEDFHHRMFFDRYAELQRLLAALGATHIEIHASEGVAQELLESQTVSGKVSDGILTGATMSGARATSSETERTRSRGLVLSLKLAPHPQPHIPTDLVWYHHEPTWQAIAREALQGRVREYAVDIRYAEDFSVNEKLKTKLQAELKLFGGKLKANVDMESETFVRELKSSKTRVLVRFASTSASEAASSTPAPRAPAHDTHVAEQSYLEDVADVLSDGQIPERGRRLLKRAQARLGLDDETVARLEARVLEQNQLSDTDREYMEDLHDCLDGGSVSPEAQRLLARRAQKLGLSPERAAHLERLATTNQVKRPAPR
ncbi:hypothetical protein ACLESD_23685 [Pyxidicoccus sp. 3LFB2]